jgi:hypothetical protein
MTLELRQRHRRIFPVLGVLIGMLFVVGIVRRRPVPELEALPPELTPQAQTFSAIGEERNDLFAKAPVHVRLWRQQETGSLAVDFIAPRDFLKPDLLAYWSPTRPPSDDFLPSDATLLGAFVGGPLVLPKEALTNDGCLILFSLANHEVVDVSKSARFHDRPR